MKVFSHHPPAQTQTQTHPHHIPLSSSHINTSDRPFKLPFTPLLESTAATHVNLLTQSRQHLEAGGAKDGIHLVACIQNARRPRDQPLICRFAICFVSSLRWGVQGGCVSVTCRLPLALSFEKHAVRGRGVWLCVKELGGLPEQSHYFLSTHTSVKRKPTRPCPRCNFTTSIKQLESLWSAY